MKNKDFDLVLRSLDGALDAREQEQMDRLLHSSGEAQLELERLQRIRGMVAEHARSEFAPFFADRVMREIDRRRSYELETRRSTSLFAGVFSWRVLSASLGIAMLVVAVGLGFWLNQTELKVPYGKSAVATLPDGSTVELSSGTTLQYQPFWGRDSRRVELNGEAFFSVEEGKKPFIVETFNARVVVHGTEFNVQAWREDPNHETTVMLASGRVTLTPRTDDTNPVRLLPGQTSSVVRDTIRPTAPVNIPVDRVLAWRTGGFAFVDQPLGTVVRSLSRRFNLEITLDNPELARLPLTYLNPKPASASDVLSDIAHVQGLQYRRSANGYHITRR